MPPMVRRFAVTSSLLVWSVACSPSVATVQPDAASLAPPVPVEATATEDQAPIYEGEAYVRAHYRKSEVRVPMRDGTNLFTSIYTPVDTSRTYPILMIRTPYSVGPYGADAYRENVGPSRAMMEAGYIFVYQDVRGCYMSEGEFVNMTPHRTQKTGPSDFDESTDTYDTVAWLVANVPNNNGRVGQWGISYPGFYAAAGMIDAHPALVAVSPQAPIADWFFDDFHHHGAFFLPHAFNFLSSFGRPRPEPVAERGPRFDHGTPDGYAFFQELGPLRNANDKYLHEQIPFWNELEAHPNYDEFWQSRNLLPHLHNVAPAVMTVGGWFDAEDLYGPLKIYQTIERNNPDAFNVLVMGPWRHGGWARGDGASLGNVSFGSPTSHFYQADIEKAFFDHYLKGEVAPQLPEAYVFETGANRWRTFDQWPPASVESRALWLGEGGALAFGDAPTAARAYDEFVSDPQKPVPFTEDVSIGMTREYMTDDQRFAARRPDVLVYQTDVLTQDLTLAGPLLADLWVSTSGTASDWVVKLIDVHPADASDHEYLARGKHMGGYQMMVRSEVIRGRFRDGYETPKPFRPNVPANIELELLDVLHTFQKGHRVMIQVQSTWFPLVDVNPHTYVDNVFAAEPKHFTTATQRVHRSRRHPSKIEVGVLPGQR